MVTRLFLLALLSVVLACERPTRGLPVHADGRLVLVDRIGTEDGPGMLDGRVLSIVRVGAGDHLVVSGMPGTVRRFVDGVGRVEYGRAGRGPGELLAPRKVSLSPEGEVWILDDAQRRAAVYTLDGTPLRDIGIGTLGATWDLLFLPDGSTFVNAPGGTTRNMGFLGHRLRSGAVDWDPYLPLLTDSAFTIYEPVWQREMALDAEGRVVVVEPETNAVSIWDPDADFTRVHDLPKYRPTAWPAESNASRRTRDPAAPPAGVQDVVTDGCGHLWVLSLVPDAEWQGAITRGASVGSDGESGLGMTDQDEWRDSLVEVLELSSGEIISSFRFDRVFFWWVGPGMLAHYGGDLPFPSVNIFSIRQEEEICDGKHGR
ncbi:MAG TPA: hypothetical protein VLA43_06240 [Longimicrobiales bacterium]|nr:hypothetical protein [Longimicrobiales bacterium]